MCIAHVSNYFVALFNNFVLRSTPFYTVLFMADVSAENQSELVRQRLSILSTQHEMFAISFASGASIEKSAEMAGFAPFYGYQLASNPQIKIRVSEIIELKRDEGLANRLWIEAQMVSIVLKTAQDEPAEIKDGHEIRPYRAANLQLAATVLMNLARFKGYIVDRSTKLTGKVDLGKLPPSQLTAAFADRLDNLSPGARAKLKAIAEQAMERDEDLDLESSDKVNSD